MADDERHQRRGGANQHRGQNRGQGRQRTRPSRGRGGPDGSFQQVMLQCLDEASRRGSRSAEAEDVLLALARDGSPETREVLAETGLDPERLEQALEQERRAALASIGLTDPDDSLLTAAPRDDERPQWGTSLREAMLRARHYLHRNRSGLAAEYAIIIGVLLAGFGTVPRALTLAGVDRDALIGRLQRLSLQQTEPH